VGPRLNEHCGVRAVLGGTVEPMTSPERPPTAERPSTVRPVDYKGEPLDAERGPGLGCFRFQMVVLVVLLVLTPLSVAWNWPAAVSAILLFLVLILLLFAGQTVIFLLRLVASDRREGTRHRPLASPTPTVGELEDAQVEAVPGPAPEPDAGPGPEPADPSPEPADHVPEATTPADPGTGDPGMRE